MPAEFNRLFGSIETILTESLRNCLPPSRCTLSLEILFDCLYVTIFNNLSTLVQIPIGTSSKFCVSDRIILMDTEVDISPNIDHFSSHAPFIPPVGK